METIMEKTVLPDRVVKAIRDQEDESEKLIGWIQLGVVVFFGILYAVSPRTFHAGKTFSLVPWFLAGYLVLTVTRIFLASRRRLPAGLLYGSVMLDMGLLLAMIFAFHLQYRQPPAFYLKAPTLLYVFIFITLRALRFEARFVIAAGCAAAIGWMTMAGYAAYALGAKGGITRDYVHYMTSNTILVGAELDKVITILTVTAILGLAIGRARKLMIKAVAEGSAVQDLSRFFAPQIVRRIIASKQQIRAGHGQHRQAAIFNCDIRGFTRLTTDFDPDALMCLISDYQALVVPIIQRHGGSIDKFLGDGILATFGAAAPTPTYAADALRACDELMAAAENWKKTLQDQAKPVLEVGAAVTAGPVIFGAVGDETRLEYTVIGDPVNLCAKLEKHNKTEGAKALTTLSAFALAIDQGYQPTRAIQRRMGRSVQGVETPMDLVVLAA
jgi:adenylate cyclase